MWTDNILMGGTKDCKWSMESAANRWLWCGFPQRDAGTMPSLSSIQDGKHFPLLRVLICCHLIFLRLRLVFSQRIQLPALLCCYVSRHPHLCNFLPLPLALIHSNNSPFPASQPISPPSHLTPSLSASLSLPLSPFTEPNLFVMSSLGKLHPICCHSLNEFICLCIGHGSISPSSPSLSCRPTPPLTSVPSGDSIYTRDNSRQLLFPQVNLETDALHHSVGGSPQSQEEGDYWHFQKANRYQLPRGPADKVAIELLESSLLPRGFLQFACCHSGAELWRSDAMLLLISLVFVILDCLLGAPTGREVYRMPQSALKGVFLFNLDCFLISW